MPSKHRESEQTMAINQKRIKLLVNVFTELGDTYKFHTLLSAITWIFTIFSFYCGFRPLFSSKGITSFTFRMLLLVLQT